MDHAFLTAGVAARASWKDLDQETLRENKYIEFVVEDSQRMLQLPR